MAIAYRLDLIQQYAEGPTVLQHALDEAPAGSLTWKPDADEWSIHEIIIHCADAETSAGVRIRQLAAETSPTIVAWDQAHWARTLGYHDQPVEPALALIAAIRRSTSALLTSAGDDLWTRVGHHTESGDYTADDWLATYGRHLHVHADQIRANVGLWKDAQSR